LSKSIDEGQLEECGNVADKMRIRVNVIRGEKGQSSRVKVRLGANLTYISIFSISVSVGVSRKLSEVQLEVEEFENDVTRFKLEVVIIGG
jgi:hypothetical protein